MQLGDKNLAQPVKIKSSGGFKNTETFLLKNRKSLFTDEEIVEIAEKSIELFRKNTPSDTGKTAESWSYEIKEEHNEHVIYINNTNIQNGLNIAILVDTGHATSVGKYVSGKHYIDETINEIYKYINAKK